MKTVAIVQARMTSTRLPGKVLADLAGKPMLERQVERMRASDSLDEIAIATTENTADDGLAALADRLGLRSYRGSETDVLDRYHGAAREAEADLVVRVTSDCPLIDAGVIDHVVRQHLAGSPVDYTSNTVDRSYPRGLDTEVFWVDVLERTHRLAATASSREHVTTFIWREQPDLFLIRAVVDDTDHSDHRWTVDTDADLAFVRAVYNELDLATRGLDYRSLLEELKARPRLAEINARVRQKPVT